MILAEMKKIYEEADCLYNWQQIQSAIHQLAKEITSNLSESNPIIFTVMNGGIIFSGQLLPLLPFPLESHYIHASRYRHETTGGALDWKVKPSISLKDRTVLILDDILDEGSTLMAIEEYCQEQGAAKVLTAVLVDKKHDRKARPGLKCHFTGLYVEDRFLFGCGMDYKGYWRNAPGIFAVKGL
jgi:hypoxanthine phosphoribosyltransferase